MILQLSIHPFKDISLLESLQLLGLPRVVTGTVPFDPIASSFLRFFSWLIADIVITSTELPVYLDYTRCCLTLTHFNLSDYLTLVL